MIGPSLGHEGTPGSALADFLTLGRELLSAKKPAVPKSYPLEPLDLTSPECAGLEEEQGREEEQRKVRHQPAKDREQLTKDRELLAKDRELSVKDRELLAKDREQATKDMDARQAARSPPLGCLLARALSPDVEAGPARARRFVALAEAALRLGKHGVAAKSLAWAIAEDRDEPLAYLQLGNALVAAGRRQDALAYFAASAILRRDSPVPLTNAALAYAALENGDGNGGPGKGDKVKTADENAGSRGSGTARNSDSTGSNKSKKSNHSNLGNAGSNGNFAGTNGNAAVRLGLLHRALEISPAHLPALEAMAALASATRNEERALGYWRAAAQSKPQSFRLAAEYAVSLRKARPKENEQFIALVRAALALYSPSTPRAPASRQTRTNEVGAEGNKGGSRGKSDQDDDEHEEEGGEGKGMKTESEQGKQHHSGSKSGTKHGDGGGDGQGHGSGASKPAGGGVATAYALGKVREDPAELAKLAAERARQLREADMRALKRDPTLMWNLLLSSSSGALHQVLLEQRTAQGSDNFRLTNSVSERARSSTAAEAKGMGAIPSGTGGKGRRGRDDDAAVVEQADRLDASSISDRLGGRTDHAGQAGSARDEGGRPPAVPLREEKSGARSFPPMSAVVRALLDRDPQDAVLQFYACTRGGSGLLAESPRACFDLAERFPASYVCQYQAGAAAWRIGAMDRAELFYRRAVAIAPNRAAIWEALANLALRTGREPEAIEHAGRAAELEPGSPVHRMIVITARAQIADHSMWEADQRWLRDSATRDRAWALNPFQTLAADLTPGHQRVIMDAAGFAAESQAEELATPFFVTSHGDALAALAGAPRVKVAYLSSDFTSHPVGWAFIHVFGHHDRSRFEIICIMTGPPENNEVSRSISKECERHLNMHASSDVEIAEFVHAEGVHVFVNLNSFTEGERNVVFPLQPALVQTVLLGMAGTVGMRSIPFLMTTAVASPPVWQSAYSEKFVYLPENLIVNSYAELMPRVLEDAAAMKRETLGLPPKGKAFVFCSFNNVTKLDPRIIAAWFRILRRAPGAVMWIMITSLLAEKNLFAAAARAGLADRFVFTWPVAYGSHLSVKSNGCDLFLDSPIFNAHTTAIEALWAAIPILTLPLASMASRVAASEVSAFGLGRELIAKSLVDYEATAVGLATDPARYQALRDKVLRARTESPVFDTARFVRNWERAIQLMLEVRALGQRKHHIVV